MTSDAKRKLTSLKALIIVDGWFAKFVVSRNSASFLKNLVAAQRTVEDYK